MIRSEAESIIRLTLGRTGTALQTEIIAAMNLARGELEKGAQLPWFLITELSSVTCTIDEERVPVPSDFLRELEEESGLWITDSNGDETELPKEDYDEMRVRLTGSGLPTAYALVGDNFRLRKIPDVEYSLKMFYFKQGTTFTVGSDVETEWLKWAPEVIIAKAGRWVAMQKRDAKALEMFNSMLGEAISTLWIADEARRQAGNEQYLGEYNDP